MYRLKQQEFSFIFHKTIKKNKLTKQPPSIPSTYVPNYSHRVGLFCDQPAPNTRSKQPDTN